MTSVCGLILEVRDPPYPPPQCVRPRADMRCCRVLTPLLSPTGAPVDVGMSIDIASIDMVSEVNMVSLLLPHPLQ